MQHFRKDQFWMTVEGKVAKIKDIQPYGIRVTIHEIGEKVLTAVGFDTKIDQKNDLDRPMTPEEIKTASALDPGILTL